jgi:integral membrane protein (TIGR00529 family)
LITWVGFFFAIVALLIISTRNLALAMFVGAFILGIFTINARQLVLEFWAAISDISTLLLALTVGLIPLIGGTLKYTGQMDNLVNNFRVGKKALLGFSPALIGMMPMPGGALLSCPLVQKSGKGVSPNVKTGLNVWFRHILYLIYPLAPALIVSTRIAGHELYQIIPYLIPFLIFSMFLGYIFFLRNVPGKIEYRKRFKLKKLISPLTVILLAPLIDFSLKSILSPEELTTLIGVTTSLILALLVGKVGKSDLVKIIKDSKPWNFAMMIIGIIVFLNVFVVSGIPELIVDVEIPAEVLCVVIAFFLGFGTGRIIIPAGIVIPMFLTKFGPISPLTFAVTYFSIFLGYIITPVHPCVSLTAEFFKVNTKNFLKVMLPPTLVALGTCCAIIAMFGA